MTESEASRKLKIHTEYLKYNWKPHPDYDVLEAISIAISALEKQIPKKLIRRRATDDDVENELRDFITRKGEICRCPSCGDYTAIYEMKYCMECGQRLDWGTESEG